MRLFGSKKSAPPPPEPEGESNAQEAREAQIEALLNRKEVELYPLAVKLLWHYYIPDDKGKAQGTPKEFPGPIDEMVNDCVKELEKAGLIEVVPSFSDFGVTARLTKIGLEVMAAQTDAGRLAPVEITDPGTRAVTVYKQVNLGFS